MVRSLGHAIGDLVAFCPSTKGFLNHWCAESLPKGSWQTGTTLGPGISKQHGRIGPYLGSSRKGSDRFHGR